MEAAERRAGVLRPLATTPIRRRVPGGTATLGSGALGGGPLLRLRAGLDPRLPVLAASYVVRFGLGDLGDRGDELLEGAQGPLCGPVHR